MGPTNIALVKLFEADQALRSAQERYDSAARGVRIQERRVKELKSRLDELQASQREAQAQAANLELDLKTRDAHIEKLRTQQQNTRNNREYQAILLEINTQKIDRSKVEDATIKVMEQVERNAGQITELSTQLDSETAKLEQMRSEISDRLAQLQAEIDRVTPEREQAAKVCPPAAQAAFDRLADRYDGEAMAALTRTHPRREEYACTACNIDVVTDVYNRLHVRDDLVFCPSCGRLLYIPDDLTPEQAINQKKTSTPRKTRKAPGAAVARQSSAVDVLNSMQPDPDDTDDSNASPGDETSVADQSVEQHADQHQ